jgi:E3 ubiquitin ligase
VNLQLATLVPDRVWAYAILGAFAGVYLFYRGFRMLQRKRLIENTPSSKIRSAAMGLVEVSGLATGPYTINAPITGKPCYLHRTVAWEWRKRDKSSEWVQVADETMHVPFFLDDNTGRVLVDPLGAEMEIHRDFGGEFSQSLFSCSVETPANVANFLMRHGANGDHRVKVEEYCIKPKNALFVLGTLAENHGTTPSAIPVRTVGAAVRKVSFRLSFLPSSLAPSTRFTLGATAEITSVAMSRPAPVLEGAQREKVAAAMMKAGITNPVAWAAAGIMEGGPLSLSSPLSSGSAAAGVAPAAEPAPQFDLHPPVMLMRGAHNPAFFISWQSQREVVRSLGWKSAAMIWGGPALTLVCVYYLAAQAGWL